jgi:ferredoxin
MLPTILYVVKRGRSRKFNKQENRASTGKGDCIDCKQCVNVCPTGIDIRNGTQLECKLHGLYWWMWCHYGKCGTAKGLIRYVRRRNREKRI